MKGHGLGLGFVIGLVAQGHAVIIIIIINLVIVASKKKFAKRLPFGFTPTTLKVLQPSLFSEPLCAFGTQSSSLPPKAIGREPKRARAPPCVR